MGTPPFGGCRGLWFGLGVCMGFARRGSYEMGSTGMSRGYVSSWARVARRILNPGKKSEWFHTEYLPRSASARSAVRAARHNVWGR